MGENNKRPTCISFLRDLYTRDPLVSNERALKLLRAKFPNSSAGIKSIITWKKMLRDSGINIPKQRANNVKKT